MSAGMNYRPAWMDQGQVAGGSPQALDQHNTLIQRLIANANAAAQAGQSAAQTGYGLTGDLQGQYMRVAGMENNLAQQQRSDQRYTQGLQLNLAQQQQSQQRYLNGLDENLQQTRYSQSNHEIPNGFSESKMMFGYR